MGKTRTGAGNDERTNGGAPSSIGAGRPKKPPLTDAERHKRFVNMACETQVSDNPEDFDEAFFKIVTPPAS
jgi:hypothetical protein